ncbi:MAG: sensor domain-containing diguanylate cyclase [Candidatus Abyssobacteria bacterium SURF_5]|uniref:diguanylate cyclase n=1 Tax=Abyssobacteria bacterium (strain SURF_5) TaxID=2093360 RepID=A0A3A4P753_ABYX5|nr:MAG: sensor domain-containing diguanylate cyclase [Candidatus Abyssubacteria bacterium SURF_5]
MYSFEPVIIIVATPDEKVKDIAASAAPERSEVLYPSNKASLYGLLMDLPVDVLLIEENFDRCPLLDHLPIVKKMSKNLSIVAVLEERASEEMKKVISPHVFDLLMKPLQQDHVRHKLKNAVEHVQLLREVSLLEQSKQAARPPWPGVHAVSEERENDVSGPLRQFFSACLHLQDINKLLDLMVGAFSEYFVCAKAAAVLLDEETGKLQIRASRGFDNQILQSIELNFQSGIYFWLRKNNRILSARELSAAVNAESMVGVDKEMRLLQAEIASPLLGRKYPVGFVTLGQRFSGEPFSPKEAKSTFFLARHAGAAIENAFVLQETRQQAVHDELTQLYNRHYWKRSLEVEIERSKRYDRPLSVAIFDIDHFKIINDKFGHQTGDEVLRSLARYMTKTSRHTDVIGRYGGEEFIAILPETTAELGFFYCERLRQDVEQRLGEQESDECIHPGLTISGGMTTCDRKEDTSQRLIERADQALYAAKREGRNRIHQQLPA